MNLKMTTLALAVLTSISMNAAHATPVASGEAKSSAVLRALAHMQNVTAKSAGASTQAESFIARDVVIDADGREHVRFQRMSKGLRVIGGDMVVHGANDGSFAGLSHDGLSAKRSSAGVSLNATPDIEVSAAAEDAALDYAAALFKGTPSAEPIAEKVFYARDRAPTLAFDVKVNGFSGDGTPSEMHYIIDAKTNLLLDKYDNIRTLMARDSGHHRTTLTDAAGKIVTEQEIRAELSKHYAAKPHFNFALTNNARDTVANASLVAKAAAASMGATGIGNSLISGVVSLTTDDSAGYYRLSDPSRGNHYVVNLHNLIDKRTGLGLETHPTPYLSSRNVWGDGTSDTSATVAVDAAYGQSQTWDYYKNVLGRNGIANDGRGSFSRVHYSKNFGNAFWSDACFCMTYGDAVPGFGGYSPVALDIVGHEMTHGVTANTARLIYSGEAGGLNESFSDMVGTAVEFYANNPRNLPNYFIGERLTIANAPEPIAGGAPFLVIRAMLKPSVDGRSRDCYTSDIGTLDPHYSSGVGNHFFYLLAEGAVSPFPQIFPVATLVCNGDLSLVGIGRDTAMKIVYRALSVYMTETTSYAGARAATLKAAIDLHGANSAQYNAVAAAWAAVNVN